MTQSYSFGRAQRVLAAASAKGTAEAAETFATTLRNAGESVSVQTRADGSASVTLEGAGAVTREFGTRTSPARPVLSPALQESRARMKAIVARKIAAALHGKSS